MRQFSQREAQKAEQWNEIQDAIALQQSRENAIDQARQRRQQKQQQQEQTRLNYGKRYIGVLDSLEQVEDQSGNWIAVFDSLLFPDITDPMALAAFIVNSYLGFSFMITVV